MFSKVVTLDVSRMMRVASALAVITRSTSPAASRSAAMTMSVIG